MREIAEIAGGRVYGPVDRYVVRTLLTDSRKLSVVEGTLFFALETTCNDGHRYIEELYGRGVRGFVVSRVPANREVELSEGVFMEVEDVLGALQRVGSRHRHRYDIPLIGITGSNGKTVVKEFLYQLLQPYYHVVRSPGSWNSQVGVPLSLWEMRGDHEVGIFEAGISEVGEMEKLEGMISPSVGILTYLGEAHQAHFATVKEKCKEKLKLFGQSEHIVYPGDDAVVEECIKEMGLGDRAYGWKWGEVKVSHPTVGSSRLESRFDGGETYEVVVPFRDEASLKNVVTCMCALRVIAPEVVESGVGFGRLTQGVWKEEEVVRSKVHQTKLEVDLGALGWNYRWYRGKVGGGVKMVGMVKADGYGHGGLEVGRELEALGCEYLAVALADEGAELRRAGIRIPIMVMNPEVGGVDVLLEHYLEPEVYSMGMLEGLLRGLSRRGMRRYPIHLKFDTGMRRLGFGSGEVGAVVEALEGRGEVSVVSCFTHLAGSDEAELDGYTEGQLGAFKGIVKALEGGLGYGVCGHVMNSAGVERFGAGGWGMVRVGIGLYGIGVGQEVGLKLVGKLKTVILQIREVGAGESVGYGCKGVSDAVRRIGVLPIGYADGLRRGLGNGVGRVWVGGVRCGLVGNVCMDTCMVDVTGVAGCAEGDEVVVWGSREDVEGMAGALGTIPYEIMTGVSGRVKVVPLSAAS